MTKLIRNEMDLLLDEQKYFDCESISAICMKFLNKLIHTKDKFMTIFEVTLEDNSEVMSEYSIWIIKETQYFLLQMKDNFLIEHDFLLTMDLLTAMINEIFNFEQEKIMLSFYV